eukprot:1131577-Alexandrium_andersonii.AAC.1
MSHSRRMGCGHCGGPGRPLLWPSTTPGTTSCRPCPASPTGPGGPRGARPCFPFGRPPARRNL